MNIRFWDCQVPLYVLCMMEGAVISFSRNVSFAAVACRAIQKSEKSHKRKKLVKKDNSWVSPSLYMNIIIQATIL
jgi:hypothetical protein